MVVMLVVDGEKRDLRASIKKNASHEALPLLSSKRAQKYSSRPWECHYDLA